MTIFSDTPAEILSEIMVFIGKQSAPLLIPTVLLSSKTPLPPVNTPQQQIQGTLRIFARRPITIFVAYAPDDERYRQLLERELWTLSRQGLNIIWDFFNVTTSLDLIMDTDNPLDMSDLILLLVSPDFVSLDFCYNQAMQQAVDRHKRGAWVSPILLRKSRWERTPFGIKPLPVLPKNRVPVKEWLDEDAAFFDISEGIIRGVKHLAGHQ
jgi:hypothetical protein